ncbi:MAG: prefoldin subunit alpha [Candidatus Heimdallarchaeaceae archaeon]
MEEKELQKKVITYKILEARLDSLLKQRDAIIKEIMELRSTIESIEAMEKADKLIFSLGSNAYATGKILEKEKIIVEIGAGIALEKNRKEGEKFLKKRIDELNSALKNIEEESVRISQNINLLSSEIQELTKKAG